jgi:hypothetical protein
MFLTSPKQLSGMMLSSRRCDDRQDSAALIHSLGERKEGVNQGFAQDLVHSVTGRLIMKIRHHN